MNWLSGLEREIDFFAGVEALAGDRGLPENRALLHALIEKGNAAFGKGKGGEAETRQLVRARLS